LVLSNNQSALFVFIVVNDLKKGVLNDILIDSLTISMNYFDRYLVIKIIAKSDVVYYFTINTGHFEC